MCILLPCHDIAAAWGLLPTPMPALSHQGTLRSIGMYSIVTHAKQLRTAQTVSAAQASHLLPVAATYCNSSWLMCLPT